METKVQTGLTQRKFGLTLGIFFGLLAALAYFRGRDPRVLAFLSGIFLFFALVYPPALRTFQRLWMGLAECMGWVMTRVILTVVFYLVLTPIGFFLRMTGKDLLGRHPQAGQGSYWKERNSSEEGGHENQF